MVKTSNKYHILVIFIHSDSFDICIGLNCASFKKNPKEENIFKDCTYPSYIHPQTKVIGMGYKLKEQKDNKEQ